MRVLYSFPHPLGQPGIGTTAFHQVEALTALGVEVTVACTRVVRRPSTALVITTFALGEFSVPQRVVGVERSRRLHDRRVAGHLRRHRTEYDLVHCWPSAALATTRAARQAGIPSLLERPSAHTREFYEISEAERAALGLTLDPRCYASFSPRKLAGDEAEFEAADFLLCPSDYVVESFVRQGFDEARLLRHRYGYDPSVFWPEDDRVRGAEGLRALVVGANNPAKGVHHALRAWRDSRASVDGSLQVAGAMDSSYRQYLDDELSHPSIELLGFRADMAERMRHADVLLHASLSEGSALVTYEAPASGCVALASDHSGSPGTDGVDTLIHRTGDAQHLTEHINSIVQDRGRLDTLRQSALCRAERLTWREAGVHLLAAYATATSSPHTVLPASAS